MNIVDYLGFGRENGLVMRELTERAGISSRILRKSIEELMREGTEDLYVGNFQDGTGFFLFDLPRELDLAKRYCSQERARAFFILKRIRRLEGYIEKVEGNRYKGARMTAGFTRKEAMKLLGIDSPTLSKIENGKQEPTFNVLEKMREIYSF